MTLWYSGRSTREILAPFMIEGHNGWYRLQVMESRCPVQKMSHPRQHASGHTIQRFSSRPSFLVSTFFQCYLEICVLNLLYEAGILGGHWRSSGDLGLGTAFTVLSHTSSYTIEQSSPSPSGCLATSEFAQHTGLFSKLCIILTCIEFCRTRSR